MTSEQAINEVRRLARLDADGWALEDVVAWLFSEGRHLTEASDLLGALGEHMLQVGAPVWRLRMTLRALHPQVAAWGFTWLRGGVPEERRVAHGFDKTDDYIGSPIQHVFERHQAVRKRLDRLAPDDHSLLHSLARDGGTDYLALPLVMSGGQVSSFIFTSDDGRVFSDTDTVKFEALLEYLTPVLEVTAMRRMARSLLDTYVGPRTGNRVMNGLIKRGDGELIHAALWFSDLRDFTLLTESLPAERLLAMLNAYFELVAAAVTARGGEILRFIGDAMLIVFPAECEGGIRAACDSALDAALEALANVASLSEQRQLDAEPPIRFGVGLHVGEVIYGNVGAPDRLDFTVMGPAVNRTARLEGLTKTVGAPLLMSADFVVKVHRPTRSCGMHSMRGVAQPQEVFTLRGLA